MAESFSFFFLLIFLPDRGGVDQRSSPTTEVECGGLTKE